MSRIVFIVGTPESLEEYKKIRSDVGCVFGLESRHSIRDFEEINWNEQEDSSKFEIQSLKENENCIILYPLPKKGFRGKEKVACNIIKDQAIEVSVCLLFTKNSSEYVLDFPIPLNRATYLKLIDLDSNYNEIKDMELIDIPYFNAEISLNKKKNGCSCLTANNNAMIEINEKFPAINKLLNYYQNPSILDTTSSRPLYDIDAVYFYYFDESVFGIKGITERKEAARHGEIMASFWMPVSSCILDKNKKFPKNCKQISFLRERFLQNGNGDLKKEIETFAAAYSTRGNILLLPKDARGMNSVRGTRFEDKIDQTLWYCFEKGEDKLNRYFKDETELKNWIKAEHLECMFDSQFFNKKIEDIESAKNIEELKTICNAEKVIIEQGQIQALVVPEEFKNKKEGEENKFVGEYKFINLTKDEEWLTFFQNINKVIAYRNKLMQLGKFGS